MQNVFIRRMNKKNFVQANVGVRRPLWFRISSAGRGSGGDEPGGVRAVVRLSQSLQRRRRRPQPHQGHR